MFVIGVGMVTLARAATQIGAFVVPNGTNGAPGANGLSAYQIWLNAGNTGTEADFLASLVGTPGTNGTNGCATTLSKNKVGKVTTITAKDCNNNTLWTETVEDGADGATGATGAACQSTITSTVCGPNETVQCAESGKNGVRIAKTDCNNENPTYDYVYNGNDGANGTNGNDGVGVCDGITSANLNKTVKNTTSVYTAATSSAAGYLTNTRTMCDTTTVTTDTVQDTCTQIVDTRTSGACDGAYMMCTNQTTNATYYVCKAVTGTNVSSISSAISSAQTAADNAQSTANNKVDTATFTSYQSSVTNALADKADASDLSALSEEVAKKAEAQDLNDYVKTDGSNLPNSIITTSNLAQNNIVTTNALDSAIANQTVTFGAGNQNQLKLSDVVELLGTLAGTCTQSEASDSVTTSCSGGSLGSMTITRSK